MNADLIAQITATVMQSLSATGVIPATDNGVTSPEFEAKVQAAAESRDKKVRGKAKSYSPTMLATFEDFGVFIQGRMISSLARDARNGYFFSRRMAEFQQIKVDRLRDKREASGFEIDPLADAEKMLQIHYRNAEENEVLLAATRQAWAVVDKLAASTLKELELQSFAKLVPDFDISEAAYTAFDQKQSQQYQQRQKQQTAASTSATRALVRTETHGFVDA